MFRFHTYSLDHSLLLDNRGYNCRDTCQYWRLCSFPSGKDSVHKVLLLNKKGVRFYFKSNRSAESGHFEMQSAFPEIFCLKVYQQNCWLPIIYKKKSHKHFEAPLINKKELVHHMPKQKQTIATLSSSKRLLWSLPTNLPTSAKTCLENTMKEGRKRETHPFQQ